MRADDHALRYWFGEDQVNIAWYPYTPATVFPNGVLAYDSIREICVTSLPFEIRTKRGELLLVPASNKDAMIAAAQARGIPILRRIDVWGLILEPFVDTEFTEKMDAKTRTELLATGVDEVTLTRMRDRLARIVGDYNLKFVWNWWGLSLFDAFDAIQFCSRIKVIQAMNDDEYKQFYWEAMELAGRGKVID